ncbi:hypothetical protein DSM112329_01261 [Paraconexibacter sp. AEG42_29]|uniref:Glycosyltransferase RgtA/B/C/D-like domain-containing protein n=1 Tax=Paraconexibacter sp. AEG42_29 TaxID=2997339 RepID=A0AAU7AS37_9ACTN
MATTTIASPPVQPSRPTLAGAIAGRVAQARPRDVVLVAALGLAGLWLTFLAHYHGHVVDFSIFGQELAGLVGPPSDAHPIVGQGYDGQFFWRLGNDPLLLDPQTLHMLAGDQAYRAQRIFYPALAWLLGGGQGAALPYTLQLVAWGAVLGLVGLMATVAQAHGRSAWWGLCLGVLPGMYLGAARGLADPLATTMMIGAFVALDRRRYGWAAAATVAAVLTRETMIVLPLAIVACGAASFAGLPQRLRPERPALGAWMVAAAGIVVYGAWQAYASIRLGVTPARSTPDGQFSGMFAFVPQQLEVTGRDVGAGGRFVLLAVANPVYLAAMAGAAAVAVFALSRRIGVPELCAAGFALVAVTQSYGDHWSYTRASAPLFAALAYIALTRGYQRTLIMIACGVVLVPLYPA